MNHPFIELGCACGLGAIPWLAQVDALDDTITPATLLDRLLHRSVVLDIGGGSYRAFSKVGRQRHEADLSAGACDRGREGEQA